ncbi:MAG: hypothetical protein WA958_08360 [Tunicatimonas sp.]
MKHSSVILFLIAFNGHLLAQSAEVAPLARQFKVELGFHGLGLAYELPLADRWSIDLSTGLGGGYHVGGYGLQDGFNYTWIINDPVMYFKSEVKYVYNRPKRLARGKSLRNNAGHYVAWQTKYTTERVFGSTVYDQLEDPLNNTLLNEVHWGIQTPIGQRTVFNFHLGLGVAADYDFGSSSVYPGLGIKFSRVIFY